MARVVVLHHSHHPSNLAGAKTSLPRPVSLQLEEEPPGASSLIPFNLNLVSSSQPHAAAHPAAFRDCSPGDKGTPGRCQLTPCLSQHSQDETALQGRQVHARDVQT